MALEQFETGSAGFREYPLAPGVGYFLKGMHPNSGRI
ncbi:hypothetical protein ACVLD2_004407 [Paenibacillus sp. PvR052]|nr:hypothetical protein [Paenibacillus sp. PvP091]MBP1172321.1 hypothetical protein [Paenibacillus sp. PvR098]MBP2438702.1 hypothetical protein [Paenibacillus sp. PvP052]